MLSAIIEQLDAHGRSQDDAMINFGVIDAGAHAEGIGDRNLVAAAAVAEGDIKAPPAPGNARFDGQMCADDPEAAGAVEDILEEVDRLQRITASLLFLAKAEGGALVLNRTAVAAASWSPTRDRGCHPTSLSGSSSASSAMGRRQGTPFRRPGRASAWPSAAVLPPCTAARFAPKTGRELLDSEWWSICRPIDFRDLLPGKRCAFFGKCRAAGPPARCDTAPMDAALVSSLEASRPYTRARWAALLRAERITTPLANPEILSRLFDSTLDEFYSLLRSHHQPHATAPAATYEVMRTTCACGRNPFLAYFIAGERALLDTLIVVERNAPEKSATAATEIYLMIRRIARREVEMLCSLCQFRPVSPGRPPVPSHEFLQSAPGGPLPSAGLSRN